MYILIDRKEDFKRFEEFVESMTQFVTREVHYDRKDRIVSVRTNYRTRGDGKIQLAKVNMQYETEYMVWIPSVKLGDLYLEVMDNEGIEYTIL